MVTEQGSEFAIKHADSLMPAEKLPFYKDLPSESRELLNGQLVGISTHQITPENATYQNTGNGINNTLSKAIVNGMRQAGSKEITQNFNPSHGVFSDLLESGWDTIFSEVLPITT